MSTHGIIGEEGYVDPSDRQHRVMPAGSVYAVPLNIVEDAPVLLRKKHIKKYKIVGTKGE